MTDNRRIKPLFDLYIGNESTEAEVKELFDFIKDPGNEEFVKAMLLELAGNTEGSSTYETGRWDKVLQKILKPGAAVIKMHPKKTFVLSRIAAAAVIILVLSLGAFLYFNNNSEKQIAKTDAQQPLKNDVAPGGNKAVLTLADGTQIVLDSAANGTLTQQGKTKIIKLDDGQLAYREGGSSSRNGGTGVGYNTISTPKGGQYQIVLADGSKVWLNAASSLRFPTSFPGKERNVELTGEGYFEIAKNASKPFHVKVSDMEVEVLGTHFNVNAYEDEAEIKTTLLEGAVKINTGNATGVLKPGQQAQVNKRKDIKVVNADVDQAVAWKNGKFQFNDASIETIMKQVARWYDAEIVYEGKVPGGFVADISRDVPVSKLLQILELTNRVHFKIEGKKVTVMK